MGSSFAPASDFFNYKVIFMNYQFNNYDAIYELKCYTYQIVFAKPNLFDLHNTCYHYDTWKSH